MNIYLCLIYLGGGIILLLFNVSGIKNKKGFCNFSFKNLKSTLTNQEVYTKNRINGVKIKDEFLHWFSGFTDAEGNYCRP